ncbi:phage terminase large subunit [Flavobacterium sp. SORGH_AS_0622]|uniref:phage terminase large subunit n=1 Tax=Flavobacterium sp. SORGH_AS_0622 TaxID=3041772 RepID=UPI002784246E|nr:phage terminase large subunit [Flavobacterium sp. SORGH_AS_0622]MDQ1165919.1 PBSX family phage terminase large subunit [Flavobacterium sp. SORGH_AS_0622]
MILQIKPLKHQKEFLLSNSVHTALIGGYGAGKSHAGVLKTVIKKIEFCGLNVAYYLPTYALIKDIALPKFSEILTDFGIKFKINKHDNTITTDYGKILLRNMSDPNKIVGYEVAYSMIDEADTLPKGKMSDIFVRILGRNRLKLPNNQPNCVDTVSTPEGFGWLYEFFVKEWTTNKKVIRARTYDNPYLPENYIETLRESYSEALFNAYINGEFVNLNSASVYKSFNRKINKSVETIQPNDILYIGLDFNVTKMNAVIHVLRDNVLHAVDEIANGFNTQDICDILKTRFAEFKIYVIPDASGNARASNGASNFDIIRSNGFIIDAPRKNPSISDRVNGLNLAFENGTYYVNDDKCPNFTEALENQVYKNGVPDKAGGYDHITEAGGYACFKKLYGMKSQVL